jgi:diguanylate cyclase (GGDEF)-like protein
MKMKAYFTLLLVSLIYSFSAGVFADSDAPNKQMILQLPWYHQFQFAGYYAAKAKGFYDEAGLDISIRSAFENTNNYINPVEEVIFQRADFGVTRSDLLVHHARGLPVVMLSTIMQRSPAVLISLKPYGIFTLASIGDKPISVPEISDDAVIDVEVFMTFQAANLDLAAMNNHPENWNISALQSGETQLILGYAWDEPYILKKHGYEPVIISPMDYGVDVYGDLIFTSEATIARSPEEVDAFRKASLRGWAYAMQNPEEIALYILEHYAVQGADYDLAYLLSEARSMKSYIQPDIIELGYTNIERWQRIQRLYKQAGMINGTVNFDRFLYQQPNKHLIGQSWLWTFFIVSSAMLIVLIWLLRIRTQLVSRVKHIEQRESQLRRQAETDPLTGLTNRRRFNIEMEVGFLRAKQLQQPLVVLMLDIDHFKAVNDRYGHLAGDKVLCSLAKLCKGVTRETDICCRYGGEEFAILLNETSIQQANEIALRLLDAIRKDVISWEGHNFHYTASVGLTELSPLDNEAIDVLERADRHLYNAKAAGRNNVFSALLEPTVMPKS